MKYPRSVAMPRDVEDWLEEELEARGIDSVVYTKYILSLMLQDSFDLDLSAPSYAHPYNKGLRSGQQRVGSCPSWDQYELKRLAVIRCLMSATGKTRGIESLVDQLYAKLQFIQSDEYFKASATLQTTDYLPHFDSTLPPLDKAMDDWKAVAQPNSALTRGILRASLPENDTAILHDDLSPVEYFPLTCSRSNTMYPNTLDIYGPRLYERSANRSLERVMAGLDATFHQFWNPQDATQQPHTIAINENNHSFFQQESKPTPPANYINSMFDTALGPTVSWSLGGPQISHVLPCEETIEELEKIEDSIHADSPQEDLLTSDRTHFRPIHPSKQTNDKNVYQNGTTFDISNDLQSLKFQRSESGTLFLDSGKYMEYKMTTDDELGDEEFVPKFRVLQSNEKFCQTDEIDPLAFYDEDSSITSSLELEQADFYFPGDEFLAIDSCTDDHPECGEVAGIVTGYLNLRLIASSWDEEPMWDAQEEAMVHDLVKSPTIDNLPCLATDNMRMDEVTDVTTSLGGLNDSVWTPMSPMSSQACERCRGGVVAENKSFTILSKDLKIWEQSVCQSCSQPNRIEDSWAKPHAEDKESWKWIQLGATLSALLRAHHDGIEVVQLSEQALSATIEQVSEEVREHKSPSTADDVSLREAIMAVEAQNSLEDTVPDPFTYYMLKDELFKDGHQLLSDLRGLKLDQVDTATIADISVLNSERHDCFPADMPSSLPDKNPSFVSMWASWNIIAIDEDDATFDERTYDFAGAQKEKRRRHSSSQKMWEQPMRGESRRAHSRYSYRQFTSPRVHESVCVSALSLRPSRDVHRSFTV